jgi:uncharacterized protein
METGMKQLVNVFIIFSVLLFSASSVVAVEISKEKQVDIEKLLEITGSLAIGKQMSDMVVTQMTQAIKKIRPDLPSELFDVLREEVIGVIEESLPVYVSTIIPLYHKHYTHDEIKELIRFYHTDLGKKAIRIMPTLMQESMSLGQQWGQALAPEIQRRVKERFKTEGVDLSA